MSTNKIRIIVAGSRNFNNYEYLSEILDEYLIDKDKSAVEIISGHARGADQLGERYAVKNDLKLKIFPADWKKNGKSAGILRNIEMGNYAKKAHGVLFAFWDSESKGTKHMVATAEKFGMEVNVVKYSKKRSEDL